MLVREMIDASATAALITDPRLADNPIVACNAPFLKLTGYDLGEVIGRNCRFLSGPGTEPRLTQELRDAIRERRPVLVEILNYRKDGSTFRNAVMIAPIFDADGAVEYFLGSQMAIPDAADDPDRHSAAATRVAALSPRQREILQLMAAGQRNKQVGHLLGISERTVKMHRAALFAALGVETSADAIRVAVEAGL